MDVGSFVQENKRWLLGCAIGLAAFLIARSIVGAIYDPGPNRRDARGVAKQAQSVEVYDRAALAAAIEEQDRLAAALLRRQSRHPGLEVLHFRHHLLGEQVERVTPRLRALDIVEAEDEKLAEAADLVVDFLDLLDDRFR